MSAQFASALNPFGREAYEQALGIPSESMLEALPYADWSEAQQLNALAYQSNQAEFGGFEVTGEQLPAGFPVGEASDAELQDVLFGPVTPGADSRKTGGVTSLEGIEVTPNNTDTGLQVDYGFLPQQGDDSLGVSDDGIGIDPRIGVGDYALSLGGIGWGLVKNTVAGIWNAGAAIFQPSERLQNLDSLEYADVEGYAQYPTEPGLSWEKIGDSLSAQIAQSNENARIAKANKDYFSLGVAYSENPLMQISGLGDMAVFGTLSKFGRLGLNKIRTIGSLAENIHPGIKRNILGDVDSDQFNKVFNKADQTQVDTFISDFKAANNVGPEKNVAIFQLDFGDETLTFAIQNGKKNQLPISDRLLTEGLQPSEKGFPEVLDPRNQWNRANDSERLGLEAISEILLNRNSASAATPRLRIMSEREVCLGCQGALSDFSQLMRQSNINIQIDKPLSGTRTAYPNL